MKKKRRKKRPENNTVPAAPVVRKKPPLRIPVAVEEPEDEDEYEDDEYEDEDDLTPEENSSPSEDGDVEFLPATPEQKLAGIIYREREERIKLMQANAKLENEMAALRKEVADSRIAAMQNVANKIGPANGALFAEVGLTPGDQLTDKLTGHEGTWVVIPKTA